MGNCLDKVRLSILIIGLIYVFACFIYFEKITESIVYTNGYILSSLILLFFVPFIYLFLTLTKKGYVEIKSVYANLQILKAQGRFCGFCKQYKPERAHHCSTCKKCIKKMDHHCMWIGVCVNYDNHGDFIRFLLFTAIANIIVSFLYAFKFIDMWQSDESRMPCKKVIMPVVSFSGSVLYALFTLGMLNIQIPLIAKNITFIEYLALDDCFIDSYEEFAERYDFGLLHNIKENIGPPKYMFLCGPYGDGMSFKSKISYSLDNFIQDDVYLEDV